MADPLSARSSIVTLIGVSMTIENELRSLSRIFRDAEHDHLALLNQINDSNAVILEARGAYLLSREWPSHGNSATLRQGSSNLTDEFDQTKTLLEELGVCVKSMAKRVQDRNVTKLNKIAWLRQMKTLKKRRVWVLWELMLLAPL
jgi:hypothetical protein